MKIYKLNFDVDNYDNLYIPGDVSADFYQMFDGNSIKGVWRKLKVKKISNKKERILGDAPGFTIPVFSTKALNALLPLIKNDVEILPIDCDGLELYGINVLSVIDAIDYKLSDYETFRDGKRILAFHKYVFRSKQIKDRNIFKIPDERRREAFVSQLFYDTVVNNGLKGFKMELVWQD